MEQLNVGKELAALERLTVQAVAAAVRRGLRRADQLAAQGPPHQADRLAASGAGQRRPVGAGQARAAELANDADLRMLPPPDRPGPRPRNGRPAR